MKKYLVLFVAVCAVFTLSFANSAEALTYATDVKWSGGTGTGRSNPDNALGEEDGDFLSLGLGGKAVFNFEVEFDVTALIVETTWGSRDGYHESADVYVGYGFANIEDALAGTGGTFESVGPITNSQEKTTIDLSAVAGGPFQYVLIVDTSPVLPNRDGFDIDAVAVQPVPEPGTVLLLGAGLVALVGVGRKKFGK